MYGYIPAAPKKNNLKKNRPGKINYIPREPKTFTRIGRGMFID